MLTNLNWLNPGSVYPTATESKRIEKYQINEKLFLTEHAEALQKVFDDLARKTRKKNHDITTVINYQQLLSKKTADFVCGEPPEIETEQDTDKLIKVLEKAGLNSKLYEAVIDISRYGNAIIKHKDKGISAVSPKYWFPIVDATDLKVIKQHVIAYPCDPDGGGKMTKLYAEIHDIGKFEQRWYEYDDSVSPAKIGTMIGEPTVVKTGLPDFAVQPLTNITHSGSIYGIDDYTLINSIVAKIIWRLHCIDTVLDKHSEPSMSGPDSALSLDPKTGMYFLDLGNYFKRNSNDDPAPEYITWNGNLEAAYKEIETLVELLHMLSEMGQAFTEGAGEGGAESGRALKLRMVSPRIKAARIVGMNEGAVKRIITQLAQVNGVPINYDSLTLHWGDGLPADEVEEIETLSVATGNKPIMSQYSAMKRLGLSDEQVEAELEQIATEQATSTPTLLSAFSNAAGVTADEETDE